MKRLFALFFFTGIIIGATAQRLSKVNIAEKGSKVTFAIMLDQDLVLELLQDGSLGRFGVDRYSGRADANYRETVFQNFDGRVEYYDNSVNEAFRGKLKYIGGTLINYYATYEDKDLVGKIKSIGSMNFNYYSKYDDALAAGKIKSVGQLLVTYYSNFENDGYKGKVKSIGNTGLTYFSSMDDKAFAGKIKSFNGNSFIYYSSMDQPAFRGALKSGNQLQMVNGITFRIHCN